MAAEADDTRLPHLLESYRGLVRARVLESRWAELEEKGANLPRRAARGVEAALAGAAFALGAEDWVLGEGTELPVPFLRGATLSEFVAHAFGRAPNPWNARARRTLASDLRNGAHVTQGVGVAWGAKIERRDVAVLVTFDDAIRTTGEFHNGVNFAGVFKAPAIFLCLTTLAQEASAERAADFAAAYGIASAVCDGCDFFAVAHAVGDARKRAASGLGPTLLEARIDEARASKDDALVSLRRHLESRGFFDVEHEARTESEAASEIALALSEFAPGAAATATASVAPESRIVVPTRRRTE